MSVRRVIVSLAVAGGLAAGPAAVAVTALTASAAPVTAVAGTYHYESGTYHYE